MIVVDRFYCNQEGIHLLFKSKLKLCLTRVTDIVFINIGKKPYELKIKIHVLAFKNHNSEYHTYLIRREVKCQKLKNKPVLLYKRICLKSCLILHYIYNTNTKFKIVITFLQGRL